MTIFGLLTLATLAFITLITFKVIIRPLLKMRFYKKQGIPCYYFPLIGVFFNNGKLFKKHGDFHYYNKIKARKDPSPIFCTNFASDAVIYLNDPALVKEFYLNPENYMKDTWYLGLFTLLLGEGLITAEGNQWKKQRKVLSSAFHFELMKSMLPRIQATAHQNFFNLQKKSLNEINILSEFQKTTGQVIGKLFFGEQLDILSFEGQHLTLGLAKLLVDISIHNASPERLFFGVGFIKLGLFKKHREIVQRINSFREVCYSTIQTRKKERASQNGKSYSQDMLDLLLNSADNVNDEEIIDQFISFFVAGMDTTSHLLTMVIYYLDKYPQHKVKMVEEINQIYKSNLVITLDDLNKQDFTISFIKETLRMMTPVTGVATRKVIKNHSLKDIVIRKGDSVNVEQFYNNFNTNYFKDVDDFNPYRWMEKDHNLDAYVFIPFAAGPRNCIGQHLAMNEARIILAEFLTMYDFSINPEYDLKMNYKFIYEPVDPILLKLTPKQL